MKKISILILLILILFSSVAYSTEGSTPYIPSRLEWFAMEMNVNSSTDFGDDGITMKFVGLEKTNEILIFVRYLPKADREILNTRINYARKLIKIIAKNYGWDKWLKIKEDVKMANLEK